MTTFPRNSALRSERSRLLNPPALARIARLELVAKQVMDGYVQGMHRSRHLGFALDFAQHRQYVPGDDVKRIDWRLFAKADRYYIKQYEVTTNLRAHIVLDASPSMTYRGGADALSKLRYAQFLAACLAYLILHQQDAAGLITFDAAIRDFIPPRSASSHLMTLTDTLDNLADTSSAHTRPAAATGIAPTESPIAPLLHQIAERLRTRGMVIIISDFLDEAPALIEAFHHLRHKRHEVILLHVMADDELTFPFRKFSLFENLERAADKVKLDPALMRAQYLDNLAAHLKALREGASRLHIQHDLLSTATPFDEALAGYLAKRMGSR